MSETGDAMADQDGRDLPVGGIDDLFWHVADVIVWRPEGWVPGTSLEGSAAAAEPAVDASAAAI